MGEKYNLREKNKKDVIKYLSEAPSRMYDSYGVRNNIDNCDCPGCPCADSDLPVAIIVAGAALLATTTGILAIVTAADLATGK